MLAQDRQLHISSLLDLGFEFDADPDLPEFATFIEASMSQCAFLFRDSIPSSSQIHFLQQMNEHQERAENQEKVAHFEFMNVVNPMKNNKPSPISG